MLRPACPGFASDLQGIGCGSLLGVNNERLTDIVELLLTYFESCHGRHFRERRRLFGMRAHEATFGLIEALEMQVLQVTLFTLGGWSVMVGVSI